ncbi:hypothetical protein QWM81_11345 [Streptomyces ficellus]|uniref:PrgI family protein n=1 Tax=Streptomyces ficellus TaxID=1977088 RepID=A0ABT7Z571_9ACTN|nr:hypothetical protein [Streptomyces ficellus]MDN3294639.1 hypothetical protein [Streptomyces ficellus]
MRKGYTFTRHFDLETRQHELMGLDLGEGVPRRTLILGVALFATWCGALVLIFGAPSKYTFSAYMLPPLIIAVLGAQRNRRVDRRRNLTCWALTWRYVTSGHRPLINGGRRAAERSEWIPVRARWGDRIDKLLDLPGFGGLEPLLSGENKPAPAASPVRLDARARMYGPDRVWHARKKAGLTDKKTSRPSRKAKV